MRQFIRNPYLFGPPIDNQALFFGREELFRAIEDDLFKSIKIIILYGQRRIGKSSVLCQIPQVINLENFKFIPFSLEGKSTKSLAEILHDLARVILDNLRLSPELIPALSQLRADREMFTRIFLPAVYKKLGNKNLVLLLDEFDVINDRDDQPILEEFFGHLNSIIEQQPQLYIIPVVGRQLNDLNIATALFRRATTREIGLLTETSAKRLITEPSKGILEYDSQAIATIIELSARHPYFTQVICSVLFERAREKEGWKISAEDVIESIDNAIQAGSTGLEWFRQGLPIAERVVFAAVAEMQERGRSEPWKLLEERGVSVTESLHQAAKKLLEGKFILERDISELSLDAPYIYAVTVKLVQLWFLKEHSLEREILALDDLDRKAQQLYQQANELGQNGDITQARELYKQVLLLNPNHFQAMSEMAKISLETEQIEDIELAVEYYSRLYKAKPTPLSAEELVELLYSYGLNLMLTQKQPLSAKSQLERALQLDPDNRLVRRLLAQVQEQIAVIEEKKEKEREQTIQKFQYLSNPFYPGAPVPPEHFVGREFLINSAFDSIVNRSHLSIYGETGVGKTSFLQLLTSPQVWQEYGMDYEQAVIIYLNCTDIIPFRPEAFWREILKRMQDIFNDDMSIDSDLRNLFLANEFDEYDLRLFLRNIGKNNRFLLLLLDNYEAVTQTHQNYTEGEILTFLSSLRNLAIHSRESRYFSAIIASKKPLNKLISITYSGSPWYNHYLFIALRPFKDAEINTLLNRMPDEFHLEPQLKNLIRNISSGYPFLLQNACYLIYNNFRSGYEFNAETFIKEFIQSTKHFFQDLWSSLTETEQTILMLIALHKLEDRLGEDKKYALIDITKIFAYQQREIFKLEDIGIITKVEMKANIQYEFTSSILEWLVLKEIENTKPDEMAKRENLFLTLMSRRQFKKLANAIAYLLNQKYSMSSFFKGITSLFI